MFYSQKNEDKILYEQFLNYKNGFFIELGAMDGITFSNTKFFEDELDWKGILIEPTSQFDELILNRPNCYNFNYAISEEEGEVDFLGYCAIGGILKTMDQNYIKLWNLENNDPFKVKTIQFYKILKNIDIKKVDLFSIDVEGGELSVLKTFNWKIPVYIVLIELDGHNKNKDDACRQLLFNENFNYESRIGLNEIWINKNFKNL